MGAGGGHAGRLMVFGTWGRLRGAAAKRQKKEAETWPLGRAAQGHEEACGRQGLLSAASGSLAPE